MATTASAGIGSGGGWAGRHRASSLFHWSVTTICILALVGWAWRGAFVEQDALDSVVWIAAVVVADLMTVQMGRGVFLSMSVPVLLAVAMLHSPEMAGAIAFLGSLDLGEISGRISLERALFNRSQVALAVAASSLAMGASGLEISWPEVIALSAVGLIADCLVNVGFVTASTALSGRGSARETVLGLFGVEPLQSLALYVSMCLVAPLLVLISQSWGVVAVLLFTLLVVPFRLTLSRTQELGAATRLANRREKALARVEAVAEKERAEQRHALAGELHDEVLPALYQVHLMGEVLRQDLATGRLLELDEDLPALLEATNAAQKSARKVVRDLRVGRDPIRDLSEPIRAVADRLEQEGGPKFHLNLAHVHAAEPTLRALMQVAREAMVNSSRYSGARRIQVALTTRDGAAELTVSDDGSGFDPAEVDGTAHFGLQFMSERIDAVGGSLTITSSDGFGTLLTARVPIRDEAKRNPPG